jgi:hypothetical protein
MAEEISGLDSPIDVMYLIHKALRSQGVRTEQEVDNLNDGSSLQSFKLAFNAWATSLVSHAELEDQFMNDYMASNHKPHESESTENGNHDPTHTGDPAVDKVIKLLVAYEDDMLDELLDSVEAVMTVLNDEIGLTSIITRTKQHLKAQVIGLRIAQEDHLETEEGLVLPALRRQLDESQQLAMAKGLLIDETADDKRWIIQWIANELTSTERELLAEIEAQCTESN